MYKYYLVSILILTLLQYPCLLVEEILFVNTLGISTVYGQLFLLINLFLLAMCPASSRRSVRLSKFAGKVVVFLLFIAVYLTVRYMFDSNFGQIARVDLKNIVIGILFIIILWKNVRYFDNVINVYITVASVIAVATLVGYFGFFLGVVPGYSHTITSYGGGSQSWLNLSNLGFLNTLEKNISLGVLVRLQGYWTEPARYAQFLTFPMVLLLDRFQKRSLRHWISLAAMFIAFIFTFSNASLLSLIFFLALAVVVKRKYKFIQGKLFKLKSNKLMLFVLFISLIALLVIVIKMSQSQEGTVLSKDIKGKIENRIQGSYLNAVKYAVKYPFGNYEFYHNKLFIVQPALSNVFVKGGFPLFFLVAGWLFYFLGKLWFMGGKNAFYYYGLLSFMVAISWYGSFFQYQFLFNVALATILFSKKYLQLSNSNRQVNHMVT